MAISLLTGHFDPITRLQTNYKNKSELRQVRFFNVDWQIGGATAPCKYYKYIVTLLGAL